MKPPKSVKDQGILRWSYFLNCAYAGIDERHPWDDEIAHCEFCWHYRYDGSCPLNPTGEKYTCATECCKGLYGKWWQSTNQKELIKYAAAILEMIEAVETED